MKPHEYNLFDVVALAQDIAGTDLRAGQTGTIVEQLSGGAFEVEFTDAFGCTLHSLGLLPDALRAPPTTPRRAARPLLPIGLQNDRGAGPHRTDHRPAR